MKRNIKLRRFMSAGPSAALALSLAAPSFALEGKEVKGEPAVGGDSEVTVQVLCDHGHTHWEDNGDGTHDEICDDCGDVATDDEPHSDDDGNGVCDKCGENSHQVLIASIPVVLPIMAKVDGSVTVPSNAEIANMTEGRTIRVKNLDVTLSGGWSLVDGSTTFTAADKGSKLLAMGFRGTPVAANGSMDMTQSDWSIAIDGSLPLEMRAAIPAQAQKSAESSIGKVTFTLDWAEGSVDPEPKPPVEEVPTNIDRSRMAEAFGGTFNQEDEHFHTAENTQVKTMRFDKGKPANGVDISSGQNNTVLATMDDECNGVIYFNNSYLSGSATFLFCGYNSLTSIDFSNLDTSNVTDMMGMFGGCSSLTSLDVSGFDTSKVTVMAEMFLNCTSLASLDLSNFNTSKVTSMRWMFSHCSSLLSLDVSNFDTSKVVDMAHMFSDCDALASLDLSNFDTSNVTDMSLMFYFSGLTSLDLSSFNTSNVMDMSWMFGNCSSLVTLDVSGFNTHKVKKMDYMFASCTSLPSLDVSGFDTSMVTDMSFMFSSCTALPSLDLSNFDTRNVTIMGGMFYDCISLVSLNVIDETTAAEIFTNSSLPSTCTIIVGSPAQTAA